MTEAQKQRKFQQLLKLEPIVKEAEANCEAAQTKWLMASKAQNEVAQKVRDTRRESIWAYKVYEKHHKKFKKLLDRLQELLVDENQQPNKTEESQNGHKN